MQSDLQHIHSECFLKSSDDSISGFQLGYVAKYRDINVSQVPQTRSLADIVYFKYALTNLLTYFSIFKMIST